MAPESQVPNETPDIRTSDLAAETRADRHGTKVSRHGSCETNANLAANDTQTDRMQFIDALRGFAMFGIVVVNLPEINTRTDLVGSKFGAAKHGVDFWLGHGIYWLLASKSYMIFAFLFGVGMSIFAANSVRRGDRPSTRLRRRLTTLAVLGCLHSLCVWWGDILLTYALFGLVTMPLLRLSPRALAWCATIWLAVMGVVDVAFSATIQLISRVLGSASREVVAKVEAVEAFAVRGAEVYAHGSFVDVSLQRVNDYLFGWYGISPSGIDPGTIVGAARYSGFAFGLVLLGAALGKSEILRDEKRLRVLARRAFGAAAAATTFYVAWRMKTNAGQSTLKYVGSLAIISVYVSGFVSLWLHPNAERVRAALGWFAPVGRMSLSTYLGHTLLGSLVMYGYGLGRFGNIGLATLFAFAICYYVSATVICRWWLERFAHGPFEWMWRSITYGHVGAIRRFSTSVHARSPRTDPPAILEMEPSESHG